MALTFRLFAGDDLRVRALTVVSTAGLVGLAVGPTIGGFVLAVAPWQVLLVANVPIALVALVGIRSGVAADRPEDLHRHPLDLVGAVLGTAAVVGVLVTPTLAVSTTGWPTWAAAVTTVGAVAGFVVRERSARHPLLDLALAARPLVASGLAYKAAAGLATAGLSYAVTLQLQAAWGWPPALAAIGTLPQVVVLLVSGRFVGPFVRRVGLERAAWTSARPVVVGLAVFTLLGRTGYPAVVGSPSCSSRPGCVSSGRSPGPASCPGCRPTARRSGRRSSTPRASSHTRSGSRRPARCSRRSSRAASPPPGPRPCTLPPSSARCRSPGP